MAARHVAGPTAAPSVPVVLVHGFVISSRYWEPLMRVLGRRLAVYAPDLPGFGASTAPSRVLDVGGLADALAAWLDAMGMHRVNVVANSFGCQIAAELAVRRPALVARVVLQGPTVDPSARSLPRLAWRLLLNSRRERPRMGAMMRADYRRAGVRRIVGTARAMVAHRIEDVLPRLGQPALVLAGSRDPIAPPAWAAHAAALLPHGRLVALEGAAHTINMTDPERFAAAVLPFLAGDHDGR